MEVEEDLLPWLQPLQVPLSFFFFSFTLSILILSLLLIFLRSRRPWCNCHVCYTYMTSGWSSEFHNLCDWYTHLLRESPTKTIHVHVLCNTITANPDNVEYMLKTRFDNYPKGKVFSSILGDLLGHGIFNVDGDRWRFQRKMASHELLSLSVRTFASDIVSGEVRRRLLPLLSSASDKLDGVLDLQDVFRRFTFDTICKVSFGLDPGCLELSLPISAFASAFDMATKLSASRAASVSPVLWKLKRLLNWGSEKELRESVSMVNVLAEEVIRQRRKMGFSSGQDLLSRFMGSVNDDKYLRDIVVSFLLAGRDTVASGLTTFFLLLSNHPEVESSLLEEITRVTRGGDDDDDDDVTSLDQLRDMHYVHAALHESMRLYPPVQIDSKFAVDDDTLPDGTIVRKGTRVTYHSYAMGRMEEAWGSDCMEFRPERWLKNGVFTPASPFKYPVFQAGTRVCLGKEMALMEMKSVAVSVVRRFQLTIVHRHGDTPKFSPGLTASLSGGLPAKFRRRTRCQELQPSEFCGACL